jgi:PHD/YefM family antitoxin component YafN of YafNO toxin-antitoxin module
VGWIDEDRRKIMHTITIKSQKPMVVIPMDEYESLRETIMLLSANPKLPAELKRIRRQMEEGRSISLEEFKKKHRVR